MNQKPGQRSPYVTSIDDCDVNVTKRKKLARYRAKREEWLGWYKFREDEPHGIERQIFSMIFIDLGYRTLAEPRHKADKSQKIAARSNLLAHLLDQGYVASQVLAIRRLLDKGNDVISVRRLLDDIFKNRHLLTRENYVCYDGLPYDPDAWQELPPSFETRMWGIQAPGLSKYAGARARHEAFDRLSGVLASERKRDDLIRESVFQRLKQWLEVSPAKKIITLSHKFLAHAADMSSRGSLEYSGVKLTDIAAVHRAIIRVERAIANELLFIAEARDVVPMPPLGLFQDLDTPYALPDSMASMQKLWDQLTDERNKWAEGVADELVS
jgi:hypothetical protein